MKNLLFERMGFWMAKVLCVNLQSAIKPSDTGSFEMKAFTILLLLGVFLAQLFFGVSHYFGGTEMRAVGFRNAVSIGRACTERQRFVEIFLRLEIERGYIESFHWKTFDFDHLYLGH